MAVCPSCGKTYEKNATHQKNCAVCAYQISIQKGVLRARTKRAAKEQGQ